MYQHATKKANKKKNTKKVSPGSSGRAGTFTTRRVFIVILVASIMLVIAGIAYYQLLYKSDSRLGTTSAQTPHPKSAPKTAATATVDVTPGETKRDIPYCNGKLLDLYEPRRLRHSRSPIVMYLHGGGWARNDKASEQDQLAMIDGLRDEGYTVVSIDYHIIPTGYFPRAVEDTLCAVRFLRANAAAYYLDADKIAAYGFSAGGYLASMAGVVPEDSEYETELFADQSSRVGAVVTLAGLFSFTDGLTAGNRERIANFLHGADPGQTDVMNYISADDAPHLLLHGAEDQSVLVTQDELLADRLLQVGVRHERHLVQNAEHGLNPAGGEPSPSRGEIKQLMAGFIRRELENPPAAE